MALVIIGLLVGGILAGQSLVRAGEIRSVTTESSRFSTALLAFRDKYFALPGDIGNATVIWGTAAACPGTSATPSNSVATCNGNNDGQISTNLATANEAFRFWQHLGNAGLVEGAFNGVAASTTASDFTALPGSNVPRSRLHGAGWSVGYVGAIPISSLSYFDGSYGNVFYFGGRTSTGPTHGAIITGADALDVDRKMDDERPATGSVMTLESEGGVCTDLVPSASITLGGSRYRAADSIMGCSLVIAAYGKGASAGAPVQTPFMP